MMYRSFVLACFLGVLLKQVYADRNEKVECLKHMMKEKLGLWQERIAKIRSCQGLLERVEELYEYFEDCSIDASAMDSLSSMLDDLCETDSKMLKDMGSGKECWPDTYPLHIFKCGNDYIIKLIDLEDIESCPTFKPLVDCCANTAYKLCEGKSMKTINRFIDGLRDLVTGLCNSLYETA